MTTQRSCFIAVTTVFVATGCAVLGMAQPVYAQARTKAQSATQARYVSKAGFSFAAPPKWQRDDADISMERVRYVLTTEDGKVVASIKISALRDKESTPDSLAAHLRQNVKDNTGTVLVVRDKAVTVGKAPGILLETNNTRPSEPDTEMTLLTARNGVTAQVIMICKTADRAKYAPLFDKVTETFKWQ